jgi:hypothetical protein
MQTDWMRFRVDLPCESLAENQNLLILFWTIHSDGPRQAAPLETLQQCMIRTLCLTPDICSGRHRDGSPPDSY